MATHSNILAWKWKMPWTEEPGGLQFMESQIVGHNWATSLSLSYCFPFIQSKNPQKLINNVLHMVLKMVHSLVLIHQHMSLYWEKNTTLLFCFCLLLLMGRLSRQERLANYGKWAKPSSKPVCVQLVSTELFLLFKMWLRKIKFHDTGVLWDSNLHVRT